MAQSHRRDSSKSNEGVNLSGEHGINLSQFALVKRWIKYLFAALAVCLMPVAAHAEWYNTITFVVGSDESAPITVRYDGKTYKVDSSTTINTVGNTYTPSATDTHGYSMRYEVSSSTQRQGSNTYHTYVYTFYPRSSGYSSGYSSGGYNGGHSNSYNSGANAGRAIGNLPFVLGGGADGDAYPSLQVATGISYSLGENVRIRYTGYGFHAYGSIGKDFLFDSEYKDKVLWNAGIGSYFAFGDDINPTMDISLGLSVGQLAQWEKLSLMIDIDYTYWIGRWRRAGIFAGGSLGWGSFTEVFNTDDYSTAGGFAWNLEVGFILRIANF